MGRYVGQSVYLIDGPSSWKALSITVLDLYPIVAAVETWGVFWAVVCVSSHG